MPKTLRNNIIANYAGGVWVALMGVAFIPVYISYLGIEAYGLIGVYLAMQACLVFIDMGLTPSLSHEMAKLNDGVLDKIKATELIRSLELVYATIIAFTLLSIYSASPLLSESWLRYSELGVDEVSNSLAIMGGVVAFRWLTALYRGVFVGIQKQVWLNINNVIFATLRSAGVLVILQYVSNTIEAFFIYQGIIYLIESCVLRFKLKVLVMCPIAHFFSVSAVSNVWRFASGVTVINLLAMVLTQSDKLIISKYFSLSQMGYYTLATTISGSVFLLSGPIFNSVFPRFTELLNRGDSVCVSRLYESSTQLMGVIIISVCCVISIFSLDLLYLWTGDFSIASEAAPILSIMVLGGMLSGIVSVPYALQLASGWTRISITLNSVAILVGLPLLWLGVVKIGLLSGAIYWLTLNLFYIVVGGYFIHKKLHPIPFSSWMTQSVLVPLLVSFLVCLGYLYVFDFLGVARPLVMVVCALMTCLFGTAMLSAPCRRLFVSEWRGV